MDAAQKGSLPVSLKSTELGCRTFPLIELIPFVKHIVCSVRREVSGGTFKRYGERLFQVATLLAHYPFLRQNNYLSFIHLVFR